MILTPQPCCRRSTNSTQRQGPGIIAQKRPAKDTHHPQWQIISPTYHNNTSTTKTCWSPYILKRTKAVPTTINTQLSNKQQHSMDRVPTPVLWRCRSQRLAKHQEEQPSEHSQRARKTHNNHQIPAVKAFENTVVPCIATIIRSGKIIAIRICRSAEQKSP